MGTVKGVFGTKISGKVGQVVFRNRAGMNIVSEKPANVKNPRTFGQQAQRMCLATASAAYRGLKEICDHSFEGVTYGAQSMSLFMKEALKLLVSGKNVSNEFLYNARGNNFALPNPLLVSRGSLPTFVPKGFSLDESFGYGVLQITEENGITQTTTVAQFHQLLGFDIGDQITLVSILLTQNNAETVGVVQKQTVVNIARLIFDASKASAPMFAESEAERDYKHISIDNLDLEKSENYNQVLISDNGITFDSSAVSASVAAMCLIRSKLQNKVWQRSTQRLLVNSENFDSTNYGYVEVTATYDPSGSKYLNNADD